MLNDLRKLVLGALVALGLTTGAALAQGQPATLAFAEITTQPVPARYAPARPAPLPQVRYEAKWLAAQPAASGNAEWECLAKAVYFEARGESVKGQFAVAEVVLNRRDSKRFPRSVCAVTHQGCQFSFTCDGRPDVPKDRAAYAKAGKIARLMLDGAPRMLTRGATHFHTTNVRPAWAHRLPRTAAIGAHLFYR